jgi:hypothetical protein
MVSLTRGGNNVGCARRVEMAQGASWCTEGKGAKARKARKNGERIKEQKKSKDGKAGRSRRGVEEPGDGNTARQGASSGGRAIDVRIGQYAGEDGRLRWPAERSLQPPAEDVSKLDLDQSSSMSLSLHARDKPPPLAQLTGHAHGSWPGETRTRDRPSEMAACAAQGQAPPPRWAEAR